MRQGALSPVGSVSFEAFHYRAVTPAPSDVFSVGSGGTLNPLSNETADDLCHRLREQLFAHGQGRLGKAPIIFKFKEIFETQHYNVLTYGFQDPSTLSTSFLVTLVEDLICKDIQGQGRGHEFNFELLLQSIVMGLRLLTLHCSQPGSGTATSSFVDKLYKQMDNWQAHYQFREETSKGQEDNDVNIEILLILAMEMLAALPSDKTIGKTIFVKLLNSTAPFQNTEQNLLQAANSLQTTLKTKHTSSWWFPQFRIIDNLCLSIRLLQYYGEEELGKGENIRGMEESLMSELNDMLVKEFLAAGYLQDSEISNHHTVEQSSSDMFILGLLYIMQDFVTAMTSHHFNATMINLALTVARVSSSPSLQLKAFEVLAAMSKNRGIVELVDEYLDSEDWRTERKEEAISQWEAMRIKVLQMEQFRTKIRYEYRKIALSSFPNPETAEPNTRASLAKIVGLLSNVQNILGSIGNELTRDAPCGHLVTAGAWRTYKEKSLDRKHYCGICGIQVQNAPDVLPVSATRMLREATEECNWLKTILERRPAQQTSMLSSPQSIGTIPPRQEVRSPIERTESSLDNGSLMGLTSPAVKRSNTLTTTSSHIVPPLRRTPMLDNRRTEGVQEKPPPMADYPDEYFQWLDKQRAKRNAKDKNGHRQVNSQETMSDVGQSSDKSGSTIAGVAEIEAKLSKVRAAERYRGRLDRSGGFTDFRGGGQNVNMKSKTKSGRDEQDPQWLDKITNPLHVGKIFGRKKDEK